MWYSLFLVFAFLSFPADQPENSDSLLEGYWHGEMSSEADDGYRPLFTIDFILKEKDGVVTGFSYISVENIYAKMEFQGTLTNDILLNAKDIVILEKEVNAGMEWCLKNYFLILKKEEGIWKLEGHWNGVTSFSTCTPGKVTLHKIIPRA